MAVHPAEVMPISEAAGRFIELADDVARFGREMLLTKNGANYVALVDVRKLDYYHALEAEHAGLVFVESALQGLEGAAAGRVLEGADLDAALSRSSGKSRN